MIQKRNTSLSQPFIINGNKFKKILTLIIIQNKNEIRANY